MTWRGFRRLTGQPARPKYGNTKTTVAGLVFDSKWEAQHWQQLQLRAAAGEIRNLQRQQRIPIVINGLKVCTFIADFTYEERTLGEWRRVVADCKSEPTRTERSYRLKKKLLHAVNGIDVLEVIKPRRRS